MYPMAEFLRDKRLIWFGHVQRLDKDDATRTILPITYDSNGNKIQRTSKDNVGKVKNVDATMVEAGNVTVSNK